jgi:hypothetical protein
MLTTQNEWRHTFTPPICLYRADKTNFTFTSVFSLGLTSSRKCLNSVCSRLRFCNTAFVSSNIVHQKIGALTLHTPLYLRLPEDGDL